MRGDRNRKSTEEATTFTSYRSTQRRADNSDMYKTRIILKNLVYIIGLAPEISEEEKLTRPEYFGQYGKILKIVVNKDKPFNPRGSNGPTYSAYVTYSNEKEASLAILAVDNFEFKKCLIKASYGTTKYCAYFLKDRTCTNADCLYLHSEVGSSQIISKDILNSKELFVEQQKTVMDHLAKHAPDLLNTKSAKVEGSIFPSMEMTIEKLKKFCETNNIELSKKEPKPVEALRPTKWEPEHVPKSKVDNLNTPEFPKVAPEVIGTPIKAKEPMATLKVVAERTVVPPSEEKQTASTVPATAKLQPRDFEITEEVLEKFSELDKLIFDKLRDEYCKISSLPSENRESPPKARKDADYLIHLIKAYIKMTTSSVSTEDTLLKSLEKDPESESKDGSNKERRFELFNQRYRVALTPQSSLYKGIQARRVRSVNKNLAKALVVGVQSDKSYSHTSK